MPQYDCPHGCMRNGKKIPITTVRGWKKHMSLAHQEWSEDQLSAVVSAMPADMDAGKAAFLAEDGEAEPEQTIGEKTDNPRAETPSAPLPNPVKRVPLKSKKMKKFISGMPEIFLKSKGITMDADDKEIIDTASEMIEELFGIAFEVPDTQYIVRSKWIALLFPLVAMLVVWGKHAITFAPKPEEKSLEAQEVEKRVENAQ